jgi:hypothetical protein
MADDNDLAAPYAATEQNLRFAIGVLDTSDHGPVPVVQIYQPDWDRELLAAVRDSLATGLDLVFTPMSDGTTTLQLSARAQVELRRQHDGQTFVLQAPAWDATLTGVAPDIADRCAAECRRVGCYCLVLRTPAWACCTHVAYPSGRTTLGDIVPAQAPITEFGVG